MNMIEDPTNYHEGERVNTSLVAILNFLGHLFCHIEVNYAEEFVYMVRKTFGFTFREKYKRITRDMPLVQDRKFRVVDESLFEDLMNDQVYFYLFRTAPATTKTS
jgi:hypothetical protein